jgi:hypothetical protein
MVDAAAIWQNDLSYSPTSDLLLVTGSEAGRQRVIRRLLTNPGDYFAYPTYGAGLPAMVGSLATPSQVEAVVRSQMLQEAAVAADPPPQVTISTILNGIAVVVTYSDAVTGAPVLISFDINR